MSEPFVGEIRMFAGNFAPLGWAFCNGQLMAISDNDALFSLLGTTYGGDGRVTFALPDLRGRIPLHQGTSNPLGQPQGSETVTLNIQQFPSHTHQFTAINATASQSSPAQAAPAIATINSYARSPVPAALRQLVAGTVSMTGQSQPHDNMQPYLCISFIISLYGIYPSRN